MLYLRGTTAQVEIIEMLPVESRYLDLADGSRVLIFDHPVIVRSLDSYKTGWTKHQLYTWELIGDAVGEAEQAWFAATEWEASTGQSPYMVENRYGVPFGCDWLPEYWWYTRDDRPLCPDCGFHVSDLALHLRSDCPAIREYKRRYQLPGYFDDHSHDEPDYGSLEHARDEEAKYAAQGMVGEHPMFKQVAQDFLGIIAKRDQEIALLTKERDEAIEIAATIRAGELKAVREQLGYAVAALVTLRDHPGDAFDPSAVARNALKQVEAVDAAIEAKVTYTPDGKNIGKPPARYKGTTYSPIIPPINDPLSRLLLDVHRALRDNDSKRAFLILNAEMNNPQGTKDWIAKLELAMYCVDEMKFSDFIALRNDIQHGNIASAIEWYQNDSGTSHEHAIEVIRCIQRDIRLYE